MEATSEQGVDCRMNRPEQTHVLSEQQDADRTDDADTESVAKRSGTAVIEQKPGGPELQRQSDGLGLAGSEPSGCHRPRYGRRERTLDDPLRLGGARCLSDYRRGYEDGGE